MGRSSAEASTPTRLVAFGSAIQASILSGGTADGKVGDMVLLDVTPLSLGIEIGGDYTMSVVIQRNTAIPVKKTKTFQNRADNHSVVAFQVFEGESASTKENNLLGVFKLSNLPLGPRGTIKFEVTFDIDANSILKVSGKETTTGQTNNITITNHSGRLCKEETGTKKLEIERSMVKKFEPRMVKKATKVNKTRKK